jgi:hypothetical protein
MIQLRYKGLTKGLKEKTEILFGVVMLTFIPLYTVPGNTLWWRVFLLETSICTSLQIFF